MVPFRLLASVIGLFLVVQTVDRYGLDGVLGSVVGADAGGEGITLVVAAGCPPAD